MKRLLLLLIVLLLPVYGQVKTSRVHLMVLGSGDNTKVTFAGTLTAIPVVKGSVFIFFHGGNGVDKDGTISGSGVASGTVDYTTGAISVTLNIPPPSGKEVNVRWVKK